MISLTIYENLWTDIYIENKKIYQPETFGSDPKYNKSGYLQGIDAVAPSLTVILLESDIIWKLHGLRLYNFSY